MKPFILSLTTTFLFTFHTYLPFAQDLSHLFPAAHYTLINTSADILGLQDTIQLINSPYVGDQGVYCNGHYINNEPDSSLVMTPYLATLFDSVFALQLQFNVADLEEFWRPAFVCGNSYRYLGLLTGADSSFYALINNANSIKIENIKVALNHWYDMTLIHYTPDSLTEFYLDGAKVFEFHVPLVRNMADGDISNTNFASGRTFKGYWRNLRVYGSENISAVPDLQTPIQGIKIYPNPAQSMLQFDCTNTGLSYWKIYDFPGQARMSGVVIQGPNEIYTGDLAPGVYVLRFLDIHGKPLGSEKFIIGK